MEIQFANTGQLRWLLAVGVCLVALTVAAVWRRRARHQFATANLIDRLVPPVSGFRELCLGGLVVTSLLFMIVALVDVRWGKVWEDVPQQGIEIVFVLDVSRSMLAEDVSPNRLTRAKQQIKDTIDSLAGDRIGLVLFAGEAKQEIPMTSHYDDFKLALDDVGPEQLSRGGSRLGDAIHVAGDAFLTQTNDHKAMLIFTDGEDQESKPVEVAQRVAREKGVRIFTVGLGDIAAGARIPIDNQRGPRYLEYKGEQVWSKQNGAILQQIATTTGGAYIPAGTKQVDMRDVYRGYVAKIDKQAFAAAKVNRYAARFQWFLVPALILLIAECWLSSNIPPSGREPA